MVIETDSTAPILGNEVERNFLARELYHLKEDESNKNQHEIYRKALERAKQYGIDALHLQESLLEWHRCFKREVRSSGENHRKEPGESLEKIVEMLAAYANSSKPPEASTHGYHSFLDSEECQKLRNDFRLQFTQYKELAEGLFKKSLEGQTIEEQEIHHTFDLNKVFDRLYGKESNQYVAAITGNTPKVRRKSNFSQVSESDSPTTMSDSMGEFIYKHPQYIPVIPHMLADITEDIKRWRKHNRMERALLWQWEAFHNRNISNEYEEDDETHVSLEQAKGMLAKALDPLAEDISLKYQYSREHLYDNLDLLFKSIEGSVMLPKAELRADKDMIGYTPGKTTRRGRSALEMYINRLPSRQANIEENLDSRWRNKFQEPDVVAHALFRKLLKGATFDRTPKNLKQIAKNIVRMKERHEEWRKNEDEKTPQIKGIVHNNPRAVEGVLAGVAATVGLATVGISYPLSKQSEAVEKERRNTAEQTGSKKKKRFGFSQVYSIGLLVIAAALSYSAYKNGMLTNWLLRSIDKQTSAGQSPGS